MLIVAGGIWLGLGKYRQWQERRLLASAQAFLNKDDRRSAWLVAQQAYHGNRQSAGACAILSTIAERERSPSAILWMQRLLEIEPHRTGHLIRLALIACRFGQPAIADGALAQVDARDRNTSAFHQAAAAAALARQQYAEAEGHLEKAIALEPKNESLKISLATLRLVTGSPEEAAEARGVLDGFRKNSPFHLLAVRALLSDTRRRNDPVHSMQLAAELRDDPAATIDDRLLYLDELQRAKSPVFDAELRDLQNKVGPTAGATAAIMIWLNACGLADRSVAWVGTLPESLRSQMPVPLATAEAYTALGEWENLRKLVVNHDWGNLDFLRLAIHARVIDETSQHMRQETDFDLKWLRALGETRGNPNAASMLAKLVEGWGWKKEAEQAWWIVESQDVGQRPALEALYRLYSGEKNAPELYRVARRIYRIDPENPGAMNNVASLALLLGKDLPEAHRLAAGVYRMVPSQPVIVSTYAFSLHLQNRAKEAAGLMTKLPETALRDPSLAACYGVLLASAGEFEKAKPYLDLAEKNKDQLFKEETALVEQALNQPR